MDYTGEEICRIYECCVNLKNLAHCGKCHELPCGRYDGSDPTKMPEDNVNDLIKQLEQLRSMDS